MLPTIEIGHLHRNTCWLIYGLAIVAAGSAITAWSE